jgi:hypothetical protein
MDPRVKYSHYERLIRHAKILLPTLDRIVPAAAVVAEGRMLTSNQREQLELDCALMCAVHQRLDPQHSDSLFSIVVAEDSPEALFVRSAIGGGLNNLLLPFYAFASMRDDSEFAEDIKRQVLHPYFRLYNDIRRFHDDRTSTGADIRIGGDNAHKAAAYYKTAPFPADLVGISEVVYGLVFSALLLSGGEREFSADFTARAEGERGFIEVENTDGVFASYLKEMIDKPEAQPTFLNAAFAAGMSVHGTTISVPFRVARIV